MEFLTPQAGWFALLAIPILFLQFWRVRPPKRPVSSLALWEEVFREGQAKIRWTLPLSPTFWLSLVILTLAVFILMNPVPRNRENLIIFIDSSASMGAISPETGRSFLDEARRKAFSLLPRDGGKEKFALITPQESSSVFDEVTTNPETIRRRLREMSVSNQETDARGAIRLARRMAASLSPSRLIILTDGNDPALSEELSHKERSADETLLPVGEPLNNVGITRFVPRRSLDNPRLFELLVETKNFGDQPVSGRLEIDLNENPIDVFPVTLAPGESMVRYLTLTALHAGTLRGTLAGFDADSLAADNSVEVPLPILSPLRVLVGETVPSAFCAALAVCENVTFQTAENCPDPLPPDAVLVEDGKSPDSLPSGNLILLHPQGKIPAKTSGKGKVDESADGLPAVLWDETDSGKTALLVDNGIEDANHFDDPRYPAWIADLLDRFRHKSRSVGVDPSLPSGEGNLRNAEPDFYQAPSLTKEPSFRRRLLASILDRRTLTLFLFFLVMGEFFLGVKRGNLPIGTGWRFSRNEILLGTGRLLTLLLILGAALTRTAPQWDEEISADSAAFPDSFETLNEPSLPAWDVSLKTMRLPPVVRRGEPFFVEVAIESRLETGAVLLLTSSDQNSPIREKVKLTPGMNRFRFPQTLEKEGPTLWTGKLETPERGTEAEGEKADLSLSPRPIERGQFVAPPPRLLVIEREENEIQDFLAALREQGIDVTTRTPEGLPREREDFSAWDAVLLSNIPASAMTARQIEMLGDYVRRGGGLLVAGGGESFCLGDYAASPLDALLPVDSSLPKERPVLALALLIDHSGSMGTEKMEIAKAGAQGVLNLLNPQDYLSIITFDREPFVMTPIQRAESLTLWQKDVAKMESGGGTNLYPALLRAAQELETVEAPWKHIILLTDGYGESGNEEKTVRDLIRAKITLSIIGVGKANVPFLEKLAQLGEGRFYWADDPDKIPAFLLRETTQASRGALCEGEFYPKADVSLLSAAHFSEMSDRSPNFTGQNDGDRDFIHHPFWGIDWDSAPPVLGYVRTQAKSGSRTLLTADGEGPLWTEWRLALGKTAVWTSDIKNRWGAEGIAWPDFSIFWAQAVRSLMKDAEAPSFHLDFLADGGRITARLDAADDAGNFLNGGTGNLTLNLADASGNLSPSEKTLAWTQTAPGRYEASWEGPNCGMACVRLYSPQGDLILDASRGIDADVSEATDSDATIFDANRANPAPENLQTALNASPEKWNFPLATYFLIAALFLYVGEILVRRLMRPI